MNSKKKWNTTQLYESNDKNLRIPFELPVKQKQYIEYKKYHYKE